jgi:hypothetical protein
MVDAEIVPSRKIEEGLNVTVTASGRSEVRDFKSLINSSSYHWQSISHWHNF